MDEELVERVAKAVEESFPIVVVYDQDTAIVKAARAALAIAFEEAARMVDKPIEDIGDGEWESACRCNAEALRARAKEFEVKP